MSEFYFERPSLFLLLLIIPVLYVGMFFIRKFLKKKATVPFSSLILLQNAKRGNNWLGWVLKLGLLTLMFTIFVIGLASPKYKTEVSKSKGSVVIMVDVSISMRAEDMDPSRIDVARQEAISFVEGLPDDTAIGLIFFSGDVVIQNNLTSDKQGILNSLQTLNDDSLSFYTAIGDALDSAIGLLQNQADSSGEELQGNIIILSDGQTTFGSNPVEVADTIAGTEVKVFTIGIGGNSSVEIPYQDPNTGEGAITEIPPLIEEELRGISEATNGEFFRVSEQGKFEEVLNNITDNSLTYTEEEIVEMWHWFILAALLLLVLVVLIYVS